MKRFVLMSVLLFIVGLTPSLAPAEDLPAYISRVNVDADETTVGGTNGFEIVVYNETDADLRLSDLRTNLPKGFRYVEGSGTRNGTAIPDPTILEDGALSFGAFDLGVHWPDYRLDLHFSVGVGDHEGFYAAEASIFIDDTLIDSEVSDDIAVRAPTKLVAHGWIFDAPTMRSSFPDVSATLTRESDGAPIAGTFVRFRAGPVPVLGSVQCRGLTDANGFAHCQLLDVYGPVSIAANAGFDAAFEADDYRYYPSSAHGLPVD